MKSILIILLMVITSCRQQGGGFNYDEPTYVNYPSPFAIKDVDRVNNDEIETFVDEFRTIASSFNYPLENYSIYTKITDLKSKTSHVLGQCHVYGNDRLVLIDQSFWPSASVDERRALVFHELGHCYLNRPHRTQYYQGATSHYDRGLIPSWDYATHANWPISLMHRSLVSDVKFRHEIDFYLRELFDERFLENSIDEGTYNCTGDTI